jgi:hypothetical protein
MLVAAASMIAGIVFLCLELNRYGGFNMAP